jgi:hypothetical protein
LDPIRGQADEFTAKCWLKAQVQTKAAATGAGIVMVELHVCRLRSDETTKRIVAGWQARATDGTLYEVRSAITSGRMTTLRMERV